jgi:hypothetical protein
MKGFKFELEATVKFAASDESGKVIGRAEYLVDENRYWIRYMDATGCRREDWAAESALEAQS